MGGSMKIDKLTDSNYHAWKQKIVLLLSLKDLDEFIEENPPTDTTELAKWNRKDRKARAIIGLSLSDEHLEHVCDVETAKEIWTVILNVFERHTLLNKLSARRNFYTVTMENGEKMLTYLNRVKQLAAILKSRSVEIDDKEMAMAALNGLPASYESLIVALDALGSDEKCFTFELVKSRLLQEEQRSLKRAATSTNPRTQSALLNIRGGFRQKPPNPYANYRCEKCSNYGHSESRSWGKDVNGKRPPNPSPYRSDKKKNSENALVGAHTNNDGPDVPESDFVCLMSKLNESQFPKGSLSWISDSGCTAHMTFDKSFFHTYETPLHPPTPPSYPNVIGRIEKHAQSSGYPSPTNTSNTFAMSKQLKKYGPSSLMFLSATRC